MRAFGTCLLALLTLLSGCQGGNAARHDAPGVARTVDLAQGEAGEGTGEILGRVLNEEVLPLAGVTVRFVGSKVSSVTTDDGVFYFTNVPARVHSLNFSRPGFESLVKTVSVTDGQRATVNAVLREVADVSAFMEAGFTFRGRINCSARVNATGTNSNPECGAGVLKEELDVSRIKSMDLLPGVRWLLVEVDWKAAIPVVNEKLTIAIRPNHFESFRQVQGPRPLKVLLGPDDFEAILKAQQKEYVKRGGQVQFIVFPGEIANQGGVGAGTTIMQDFTIYGTAWYRMDPPTGYSRVPPG